VATTTLQAAPLRSIGKTAFARIGAGSAAVMKFLCSLSNARHCAHEVERLMALSDDQLAQRGIKRDQIVQVAFRNYLHE
jgi:hypothetical protein